MKAVTGVAIAVLTIALVLFGFGLRANSNAESPFALGDGRMMQPAASAQLPVLVNCGPGAQTLVRQVWMNGQPVSQVECVAAAGGVVYPGQQVRTIADDGRYDARVGQAQTYAYRSAPRRATRPARSWQKTALVIGGTTAAGAGIGGLIGGKRGALIGAAIGGGARTIYEARKRR